MDFRLHVHVKKIVTGNLFGVGEPVINNVFLLYIIHYWTDCIIDKNQKNPEIVKFIRPTAALEIIVKLTKWRSVVAKYCKVQKYKLANFVYFCILLYYAQKTDTTIEKTVLIFRMLCKSIQNLQTLQGHFQILQHFATKLCTSIIRMLFYAMVRNFTFSIFLTFCI